MATVASRLRSLPRWNEIREGLSRFEGGALLALVAALALYGAPLVLLTDVPLAALGVTLFRFLLLAALTAAAVIAGARCLGELGKADIRPLSADLPWYGVAVLFMGTAVPLFGIFKQLVLPMRGFPLDPVLATIDHALFLGHDPWTISHALFGSIQATLALDSAYTLWMILLYSFPMIAIAAIADPAMRARLLGSWLFGWILIGSAGAWLFASAGPCYYNALVGPSPSFALLGERLAAQAQSSGVVIQAIAFQPTLLALHDGAAYGPAGGISAMPSMHVAMATLFAIGGFQVSRRLGTVLALYAVVIWIGSIHLGWHYAVDGPVGALMMVGIWRASGWIVRRARSVDPAAPPRQR